MKRVVEKAVDKMEQAVGKMEAQADKDRERVNDLAKEVKRLGERAGEEFNRAALFCPICLEVFRSDACMSEGACMSDEPDVAASGSGPPLDFLEGSHAKRGLVVSAAAREGWEEVKNACNISDTQPCTLAVSSKAAAPAASFRVPAVSLRALSIASWTVADHGA